MTFDLADRGIYGFATAESLRFADLDANGHINNGSFIELLENARVSYLRQIVRSGLPRFRLVIGRIEVDFKRQMFFPGTATACARLVEVHDRKVVIGQSLFDAAGLRLYHAQKMTGREILRIIRQHREIQLLGLAQAPAALQRNGLVLQGVPIHVSRVRPAWYPFVKCQKQWGR